MGCRGAQGFDEMGFNLIMWGNITPGPVDLSVKCWGSSHMMQDKPLPTEGHQTSDWFISVIWSRTVEVKQLQYSRFYSNGLLFPEVSSE